MFLSRRVLLVAGSTLLVSGISAGALGWALSEDVESLPPAVEPVRERVPVPVEVRVHQLKDGARAVGAVLSEQIRTEFVVPTDVDTALMEGLPAPWDEVLTVLDWAPDEDAYQYRICVGHIDGGWARWDTAVGGLDGVAMVGDSCKARDAVNTDQFNPITVE